MRDKVMLTAALSTYAVQIISAGIIIKAAPVGALLTLTATTAIMYVTISKNEKKLDELSRVFHKKLRRAEKRTRRWIEKATRRDVTQGYSKEYVKLMSGTAKRLRRLSEKYNVDEKMVFERGASALYEFAKEQ